MNPIPQLSAVLVALACAQLASASQSGRIYPSGPTIPENLLHLEIGFDHPLRTPLDMTHVRLMDSTGQPIDGAFLDLPLQAADGMKVTLLMHPARVKSGVGANLALGRALTPATSVTLVVDDPAIGRPLAKTWRVVEADVSPPSPESWTLMKVNSGSRNDLMVKLHAAVSSSAINLIALRGSDGKPVKGRGWLEEGESIWRFIPNRPWRVGHYALMVHPDLEDPSGNRACIPFEHKSGGQQMCQAGTAIPFEVNEPGVRIGSAK